MKNQIKFYRNKRGLTQEQMASILNVSRQTYINYESGEAEPAFETLIKISAILKTSIDDLLNNEIYPSDRDQTKQMLIGDLEEVLKHYK